MPSEELRLLKLDECLMAIPTERDGMLVSDLDGFVAGLHCCPELIPPSEWLPLVWGEDDGSAPFDSMEQLESTTSNVLAHYNAVGTALARRRYWPVIDVYERHDEVMWELWIGGFAVAMELRPEAFAALSASGDDIALAISGLMMLVGVSEEEIELPEDELAVLNDEAPDQIADWVQLLYDSRIAAEGAAPVRFGPKVGRNDPCPCGSGKKYKKCCGAN